MKTIHNKIQIQIKNDNIKIQIGKSTSEMNENKTWDGYSKINNIPLNEEEVKKPKLTKEEELREKFKYLKKLEDLEKKEQH